MMSNISTHFPDYDLELNLTVVKLFEDKDCHIRLGFTEVKRVLSVTSVWRAQALGGRAEVEW